MKSKVSTAKKPKTTTFSHVFHHKKIVNFLGKSKLNFWTKRKISNSVIKVWFCQLVFLFTFSAVCSPDLLNYLNFRAKIAICLFKDFIAVFFDAKIQISLKTNKHSSLSSQFRKMRLFWWFFPLCVGKRKKAFDSDSRLKKNKWILAGVFNTSTLIDSH